jgi:hypothetical protein
VGGGCERDRGGTGGRCFNIWVNFERRGEVMVNIDMKCGGGVRTIDNPNIC